MFSVIVSLRSYFYLVAAWNFGDFGGCVLNLPRLTLTLVVLMSFKSGDVTPILFWFRFRKPPCLVLVSKPVWQVFCYGEGI